MNPHNDAGGHGARIISGLPGQRGLKERIVVTRHALKNALIPIVTIIGQQAPVLVGGNRYYREYPITCPGWGRPHSRRKSSTRDYTVVSACLLLFLRLRLVAINLVTDLTYGF